MASPPLQRRRLLPGGGLLTSTDPSLPRTTPGGPMDPGGFGALPRPGTPGEGAGGPPTRFPLPRDTITPRDLAGQNPEPLGLGRPSSGEEQSVKALATGIQGGPGPGAGAGAVGAGGAPAGPAGPGPGPGPGGGPSTPGRLATPPQSVEPTSTGSQPSLGRPTPSVATPPAATSTLDDQARLARPFAGGSLRQAGLLGATGGLQGGGIGVPGASGETDPTGLLLELLRLAQQAGGGGGGLGGLGGGGGASRGV